MHNKLLAIRALLFSLFLVSCSTSDVEDAVPADNLFTYTLQFDATLSDYADAGKTRAALGWKKGDVVCLGFHRVVDGVYCYCTGTATYNGSSWDMTVSQSPSASGLSTVSEVMVGPDSNLYQVKGTVTKISETATYGNFYMNDGTSATDLYIYGTKYEGKTRQAALEKLGVEVGDEIIVLGPKTTYNGTVELVDVDIIRFNKLYGKVDSTSVAGPCFMAYVVNPAGEEANGSIPMDAFGAVYYDTSGTWSVSGTTLTVSGKLKPLLPRVQFKGSPGTKFTLQGLKLVQEYHMMGWNKVSPASVTATIGSDGYSPFIYGYLTDARTLTIGDYTMTCPETIFKNGTSGWLNLPTASNHTGWKATGEGTPAKKTFTVGGVSFDMILVKAGTFEMGKSADGNDVTPVHNVTLTKDYYIGETEVTQALWKAVTGYSPTSDGSAWSSSYGLGDNYPAYNISYKDVQSFITKLNSRTGEAFRMPTEAEWEYAAKGGNKSKGYTYSGSNTIGDVAWYRDNSGSKTHEVKTKVANELGIYDMTGNVCEWCSDWYGGYSSSSVTDPTGPSSGSYRVNRGGSWYYTAAACRVANRNSNSPSNPNRYTDLGVRLVLSSSK